MHDSYLLNQLLDHRIQNLTPIPFEHRRFNFSENFAFDRNQLLST